MGGLLVCSGVFCLVALLKGWVNPKAMQSMVAGAGAWAMLAYVVAVVIAELLWLPRMWGLFIGGALFGPWIGGALSVVADMIGALTCYFIARGAGRDWVEGLLARRPKAKKIVGMLAERRGGLTIGVLRVCPVAHYTLVSYAAGMAGVRPIPFVIGNAIGILPGAVLYPIVGDSMLRPTSPTFIVSVAIMIVALIVTVIAARKILRD